MNILAEQTSRYSEILKSSGKIAADAYAEPIIKALDLDTPKQRGEAWDQMRSSVVKKAAKKRAAKKPAIKAACEELLKKSLSEKEALFLNDIKTKRKLTEKQKSWLLAIAAKNSVEVGQIEIKDKKVSSTRSCQHEDLGSLGYTHGDTVNCPNCGQLAEVW